MKSRLVFVGLSFVALAAVAQTTSINDIPTNSDGDTQITIGKGSGSRDRDFDIINGSGDVSGDTSPLSKGARDNWKKACAEWKAEIKDLNKENQVLALNCGNPDCKKEQHGTTCSSVGNYQLKVRIKK